MKTIILTGFLITSSLVFGQLQRVGIGAKLSTSDFSNIYSAQDLVVQFNFRRHFSLLFGYGMEKTIHRTSEWFEYPMPSYTNSYKTTFKKSNIPLVLRTHFGNKALFYVDLGFQATGFQSAQAIVTESHAQSTGIPSKTYEKRHTFYGSSGTMHGMWGAGLTFPATKFLMVFVEVHKNIVFYETKAYTSGNTYFYGDAFNGPRFSVGISYQLRLPEKYVFDFEPFLKGALKK